MKEHNNVEHYLKIIDEIERIRTKNNVNWMDLLRLAFTHAPLEAKKLMGKIDNEDNRISNLMKKLSKYSFILIMSLKDARIRRAGKHDMLLIFNWINDPLVRKMSFSKNKILINEHKQWFNSKIDDKAVLFWIYEFQGTPAGMVRIEEEDGSATLNYMIDKRYRGKGHSGKMLGRALTKLKLSLRKNIYAYTLPDNHASIKSLQKVGFNILYKKEKKICLIYNLKDILS